MKSRVISWELGAFDFPDAGPHFSEWELNPPGKLDKNMEIRIFPQAEDSISPFLKNKFYIIVGFWKKKAYVLGKIEINLEDLESDK